VRLPVPPEIEAIAEARSDARVRRDWATADTLRAQIEEAGWKVIDRGADYLLEPAHPPDVVEGARVRYGSSASVPSRLHEAPSGLATVVLVATDWPDDLARALDSLRAHAPAGTTVVVVADGPSRGQAAALDGAERSVAPIAGDEPEVVWTSARLGYAGALDVGIRRAAGPIVIAFDTSAEATGDIVTLLVAALEDPTVAVAGSHGVDSADLRHFEPAPAGDVDAVLGYCLAFRRDDFAARGPLDEHFRFHRNLDLWWSLVLRDEGDDRPPRRALAVELPIRLHEHRAAQGIDEAERDRLSKRNFYRIIDRFGRRFDLLKAPDLSRSARPRR
jgi:GT2 family glycosyltransferase